MSRSLPTHPSLDYLKKEAKDLLRARRVQDPHARLSDAQYAVARGYGFSSWPALKAHVASRAVSPAASAPAERRHFPPADNPLAGRWIANLEHSRRHPAYPFREATMTVRVSEETITFAQDVVDPDGRPVAGMMTVRADGQPQPGMGGEGHALVATWTSPSRLEVIDLKDGTEVARGRYEVSADGRRLVVSTSEQMLVFDRA